MLGVSGGYGRAYVLGAVETTQTASPPGTPTSANTPAPVTPALAPVSVPGAPACACPVDDDSGVWVVALLAGALATVAIGIAVHNKPKTAALHGRRSWRY